MAKCSFCGDVIAPGTGKMFVQKDAKVLYFCSGKCEKNQLKLKRKPLKTRWAQYQKIEKKDPKKESKKESKE